MKGKHKHKWDYLRQLLQEKVVYDDIMPRVWYADEAHTQGVLYSCKQAQLNLDKPMGGWPSSYGCVPTWEGLLWGGVCWGCGGVGMKSHRQVGSDTFFSIVLCTLDDAFQAHTSIEGTCGVDWYACASCTPQALCVVCSAAAAKYRCSRARVLRRRGWWSQPRWTRCKRM